MKTLLALLAIIISCNTIQAENYRLDEHALEKAFSQSTVIDLQTIFYTSEAHKQMQAESMEDKQTIAGIVAIASFIVRIGASVFSYIPFIGWALTTGVWIAAIVPWHRVLILGTDGNGAKNVALYCVTLGWCINAHHVVDGIILLLEEDKTRYVGNPKYVMFAN